MINKPFVKNITFSSDRETAILHYSDGDQIPVSYQDYARALMTLVNSDKEDILRDFALE